MIPDQTWRNSFAQKRGQSVTTAVFLGASAARLLSLALLSSCVFMGMQGVARADGSDRITILEENDSIYFNSDKHYTQGLRASDFAPAIGPKSGWNFPFKLANEIASPLFEDQGTGPDSQPLDYTRHYAVFFGQSIFTPQNLVLKPPDPHDRPYGGWLYVGTSLLQETNRDMLENLELDLGVVGPGALGKQVQNNFHQLIGVAQARGWSSQIQNEPGAMLTYERLWRVPLLGHGDYGADIVPQLGATVGNVFTYGEAGAMLRVGKNLQADYGPVRVRPALSGTDYFDGSHLDGNFGYYFYIAAQGRAVGRNIFLDGNSFRTSPSVQKKVLVADTLAGFSLFWSNSWRLDFSAGRRTREFVGQESSDVMGTAAISFSL